MFHLLETQKQMPRRFCFWVCSGIGIPPLTWIMIKNREIAAILLTVMIVVSFEYIL
jgi:hypothetical protein